VDNAFNESFLTDVQYALRQVHLAHAVLLESNQAFDPVNRAKDALERIEYALQEQVKEQPA